MKKLICFAVTSSTLLLMNGCSAAGTSTDPNTTDSNETVVSQDQNLTENNETTTTQTQAKDQDFTDKNETTGTQTQGNPALRVVSTPNPSLFPLLIAMSENPTLNASLVPVSGSSTINSAFQNGKGDALLSMTFVAAKKSNDASIEAMHLHSVNFWSGFHTLTHQEDNISSMDDLVGKNYMISGPVGTGENGGPDIFFQAAMRAVGKSATNFTMYYQSLNEGYQTFGNKTVMDDGEKVSGYHMVEPAASGIIMNGMMGSYSAVRSVDMQALINDVEGYTAWSNNELPLGGFSIAARVDNNSSYDATVSSVLTAYNNAAQALMAAKGSLRKLQQYGSVISNGIARYYGDYNVSIPVPVIVAAIRNGKLVYKDNVPMESIKSELDTFLEFVIEDEVAEEFYR
ncbi:MAG TPA: hypothetical protein ENK72_02670 [Epsilonproteobacteria bacterium]|nr:hypothetical protein [Campylobacterota bacterium]